MAKVKMQGSHPFVEQAVLLTKQGHKAMDGQPSWHQSFLIWQKRSYNTLSTANASVLATE